MADIELSLGIDPASLKRMRLQTEREFQKVVATGDATQIEGFAKAIEMMGPAIEKGRRKWEQNIRAVNQFKSELKGVQDLNRRIEQHEVQRSRARQRRYREEFRQIRALSRARARTIAGIGIGVGAVTGTIGAQVAVGRRAFSAVAARSPNIQAAQTRMQVALDEAITAVAPAFEHMVRIIEGPVVAALNTFAAATTKAIGPISIIAGTATARFFATPTALTGTQDFTNQRQFFDQVISPALLGQTITGGGPFGLGVGFGTGERRIEDRDLINLARQFPGSMLLRGLGGGDITPEERFRRNERQRDLQGAMAAGLLAPFFMGIAAQGGAGTTTAQFETVRRPFRSAIESADQVFNRIQTAAASDPERIQKAQLKELEEQNRHLTIIEENVGPGARFIGGA